VARIKEQKLSKGLFSVFFKRRSTLMLVSVLANLHN